MQQQVVPRTRKNQTRLPAAVQPPTRNVHHFQTGCPRIAPFQRACRLLHDKRTHHAGQGLKGRRLLFCIRRRCGGKQGPPTFTSVGVRRRPRPYLAKKTNKDGQHGGFHSPLRNRRNGNIGIVVPGTNDSSVITVMA